MPLVVRAFPVLPGKEDAVRALAKEMAAARSKEASEFYGHFDVTHESWHLQQTPHGPWVIGVTEVTGPLEPKVEEYAASNQPFERWFKDQVQEFSGINLDLEPLGPPTEAIFEFNGDGKS
jgi:hypothetical protein